MKMFTVIEVIFMAVIIAIVLAVAIPKMSEPSEDMIELKDL